MKIRRIARATDARRRLLLWGPALLAGVAVVATALALGMLYDTAIEESRRELLDAVDHQARFIGTIARDKQGDAAKTFELLRIVESRHEHVQGTSEFALSVRNGDQIRFLLRGGRYDSNGPVRVPFDSKVAEPSRRALRGETGTMIGPDYRGVTVMAAYAPVRATNWGVVAKIDMSEVRRPFIRTAIIVLLIVVALVTATTFGFSRLAWPVICDLERSRDEAEAANRAKSDFLAAMSHELRTPLNAIIGFSEGMLQRTDRHPLNDHQKERLFAIHKSGLQLLAMVDDVLDVAQVESGAVGVRISVCNAALILSEVHEKVVGWLADKPDVVVRLDTPLDLPLMTTDAGKVRQILVNLAGNAVKFTWRGSITLAAREEGDSIVFSVTDTGVGIPADQWKHVFERHFQIRQATAQSIKGAGVGLAIARAYAELLGGSISFTSQVGQGSTFTVRLPQRTPTIAGNVSEPAAAVGSP